MHSNTVAIAENIGKRKHCMVNLEKKIWQIASLQMK